MRLVISPSPSLPRTYTDGHDMGNHLVLFGSQDTARTPWQLVSHWLYSWTIHFICYPVHLCPQLAKTWPMQEVAPPPRVTMPPRQPGMTLAPAQTVRGEGLITIYHLRGHGACCYAIASPPPLGNNYSPITYGRESMRSSFSLAKIAENY